MKNILIHVTLVYAFITRRVLAESELCQPEGIECASNSDCCSDFCDKRPEEKFGICEQACGKISSDIPQPSFLNGKQFEYGGLPWHVSFYRRYNEDLGLYDQVCSGTLITHTAVITAASCFAQEKIINGRIQKKELLLSKYKAAMGKYHKSLNAPEDVLAQITDIENVEVHPDYEGLIQFYADDIAVVTLKTPVVYSRAVRPVCIDVGPESFEKEQLTKGAMGKVVGWQISKEQDVNQTIMTAEIPFAPRGECLRKLPSNLDSGYFTWDKICVGDDNSYVRECLGNTGGGVVFEDTKTKTYYLRGVQNIASTVCSREKFLLHTDLSSHKEFVEKYLEDCKQLCKRTCGVSSSNLPQPICSNQREAKYGEFPWHAKVYQYNENRGSYELICAGTLISPTAVISTAHCFTLERPYDYGRDFDEKIASTLKVALGKYHRTFSHSEDALAQIHDVQRIDFTSEYIHPYQDFNQV